MKTVITSRQQVLLLRIAGHPGYEPGEHYADVAWALLTLLHAGLIRHHRSPAPYGSYRATPAGRIMVRQLHKAAELRDVGRSYVRIGQVFGWSLSQARAAVRAVRSAQSEPSSRKS